MTPDQSATFAKLSATTQAFLHKVARKIAEGYEGEIKLHVKKGRDSGGRSGISFIRWEQVDDGDTIRDEVR